MSALFGWLLGSGGDSEQSGVPLVEIGDDGIQCGVAFEGGVAEDVTIPDLSNNVQGIPCDEHGWPTPEGLDAWHREHNPWMYEEGQ